VSAESFEETDTARKPWLQIQAWAISSDAATGWVAMSSWVISACRRDQPIPDADHVVVRVAGRDHL
jgi:hypothetical protein